ncbi:hypothetical protein M514_13101 [Trichuris suis]|uniref:Uncharacterized protein n=1 Tax=Trichuris suis TaxID=68888 RepID=A0A085MR84_9BILA|nr:hypothetical protein M514_13101 [Trichuris suis]
MTVLWSILSYRRPLRGSSAVTIKSGATPALVALVALSSNGNTVAGCSAVNSATDRARRSTLSASCEVRRPPGRPRSCCSRGVRQAAGWLLVAGHSAWKRGADDRQSVRRTGAADEVLLSTRSGRWRMAVGATNSRADRRVSLCFTSSVIWLPQDTAFATTTREADLNGGRT